MKSKPLTLPTKKYEYGYELAFQLAREQLAGIENIEQQCLKSGAEYDNSRKAVIIKYLNQPYLIKPLDAEVSSMSGETVPIIDTILILHYFTLAKGTPLSGKVITYKELPEGLLYFPTYYKRTLKPLVNYFGDEPHRLLDVAQKLGGRAADYGDVATTIDAFSRVPVTLVIWKGDEELSPEGSLMFDSTISDYLPTEDITVLCETITWRLIRLLKTGGDNPGKR